jgi:hypothetical protein
MKENEILKKLETVRSFEDLKSLTISIAKSQDTIIEAQELKKTSLNRWDELLHKFPYLSNSILEMNKYMERLGIKLDRSRYLFGWLTLATELTALIESEVTQNVILFRDEKHHLSDVLLYLKLTGIIFDIVLDDIGDEYAGNNAQNLLDLIERIIIDNTNTTEFNKMITGVELMSDEIEYLLFIHNLWQEYRRDLATFCDQETLRLIIKEYREVIIASNKKLEFNNLMKLGKLDQAKSLSLEIDKTDAFNPTMHIVINGLIDLSYIKKNYDIKPYDLNRILKLTRLLETLGRVGDDISTWKREVKVNDFTSFIARNLIFKHSVEPQEVAKLSITDSDLSDVLNSYTEKYCGIWQEIISGNYNLWKLKAIDFNDLFMRYLGGLSLQLFSEGYK